jgi:hypothetical protein
MNQPSPFAGQGRPHSNHRNNRQSGEFRQSPMNGAPPQPNGHGVPVPRGPSNMGNGHAHGQAFGGARSPPSNAAQKNSMCTYLTNAVDWREVKIWLTMATASHVPCKFFRQGTCQAGAACPFLHGELSQPCKYFQKVHPCPNTLIQTDNQNITHT